MKRVLVILSLTYLLLQAADDGIGVRMTEVRAGSFRMGANAEPIAAAMLDAPGGVMSPRPLRGDFDETPAHQAWKGKELVRVDGR